MEGTGGRVAEGEMVGWHHRLDGLESAQTPGDSEAQGILCAAVHEAAKSQTRLSLRTVTSYLGVPQPSQVEMK